MFEALGPFVYRHRWPILAASAAFLLLSVALVLRGGSLTSGTIRGIESEEVQQKITAVLGHPMETTFVAVFHGDALDPSDDAFEAALASALAPLRSDPRVLSVMAPDDAPGFLAEGMINDGAREVLALITLRGDFKQAVGAYPGVRAELRSDTLQITCTGRLPFTDDLGRTLERDLLWAELISLPLALLVLLLVFRTAVAAVLPVGVGGLAVVGGVAMVLQLSRYMDIAQYTVNVCSLIGLGVAIDYSLFTVSRYREELAKGLDYPEALTRAMSSVGRVVAFSGLAVGTGLAGLLFFEGSYLEAMGIGGALVVALAALFALTFLPALLAVLGPRIHAGRLPFLPELSGGASWHRMATWVMKRPLVVLVPTLAILLFMGLPFLHLRMERADVRVLPGEVEARRGYALLKRDFPDQARTRQVIAVRFPTAPALDAERVGALYDLSRRIAKMPHVLKVQSIVDGTIAMSRAATQAFLLHPPPLYARQIAEALKLSVGARDVLLFVSTDGAPESPEARALVQTLRADRAVGDGTLSVGGETAADLDTTAYMMARAPRAIAFVVGVTLLVLFLLLGSVVLPLKAVVMNFLSIAGSFGALVWVFQDGHLFIHVPRPIEPTLPVLLFCVLFGLSMDYEILMLSRMKEAFERTGDNTLAVAEGLERSAGLITSAAAIMVAVFGAFALARVVLIQAVGFGMALAVALDATLVRILLVPATMRLFGSLNWWAPKPLLRLRRWLGRGR